MAGGAPGIVVSVPLARLPVSRADQAGARAEHDEPGIRETRFTVEILDSLASITASEWDAVGAGAVERSHAYLSAVLASDVPGCRFFFVVVRDHRGRLVARACAYTVTTDIAQLLPAPLRRLVALVRRAWPGLLALRSLECAAPLVAGHALAIAGHAPRARLLDLVAGALDDLARREACPLTVVHAFVEEERAEFDHLATRGYRLVRNLPLARLHLRWPDHAHYVAAMRPRYRADHRRRLRRATAAGQSVRRLAHFAELAALCARQAANVQEGAEGFKRERCGEAYYRTLDTALGEDSVLLVVERDGQVVAHGLVLLAPDCLVATFFGREAGPPRHEWFQLMDEVVHLAFERGVRTVNLGRGSYDAKSLVGADIEPLYCYARANRAPLGWLMRLKPGISDSHLLVSGRIFDGPP